MSHPIDHATQSVADPDATTGCHENPTIRNPSLTSPERYVLGDEIARGGMGEVYRATDTVLNREVAVKVLQAKYAPTSGTARRFADEARITGQLQHPNIPAVHDLGTLPDGRPFLAMKLIKGETLDDLLKARANPTTDRGRFLAVFEQICQAVAYAHAHNVIHRDLKPGNVMVGAFGEVQVMDWGLAKVLASQSFVQPKDQGSVVDDTPMAHPEHTTDFAPASDSTEERTVAGQALGTPSYMPPEQALGELHKIDQKSDVFALGGVLCAILTGKPPYTGAGAAAVIRMAATGEIAHAMARVSASEADPELIALCKRCLAPERDDRPADADVVAKAVAALRAAADERARQAELDKVRVEGEKATAEAQVAERRKRRRVWIGAAGALAVAVVGGLAAVLMVQDRARRDVEAKNLALEAEKVKVEKRFELAQHAIRTYYTGVSEDALLTKPELSNLRKRLLTDAAKFYTQLQQLLETETDRFSRQSLGKGYFDLAMLMNTLGESAQSLSAHRKALELRRALVSDPEATESDRVLLMESLRMTTRQLIATGQAIESLPQQQEQIALAEWLATQSTSNEARAVLAQTLHDSGDWQYQRNDRTQAQDRFQKAIATWLQVLEKEPESMLVLEGLNISYNNLGIVLGDMGNLSESLAAFQNALKHCQKLVSKDPQSTKFSSYLGTDYNYLALVSMRMNRDEDAIPHLQQAAAIREAILKANPGVVKFQMHVADTQFNLASILSRKRKPAEALKSYERCLQIHRHLAKEFPQEAQYAGSLGNVAEYMAQEYSQLNNTDESLKSYEEARAAYEKLVTLDPGSARPQRLLIRLDFKRALQLGLLNRNEEAIQLHQEILNRRKNLFAENQDPISHHDVARSHAEIGLLLNTAKKHQESLEAFQQALTIRLSLAMKLPPSQILFNLAWTHVMVGDQQALLKRLADAMAEYRKAIAIRDELAKKSPRDPDLPASIAFTYSRMARVEPTEPKHAQQAVAYLSKAIELGYTNLQELHSDPGLDPLRNRADFKKLLADLVAKAPKAREVAPPPREKK